MKSTGLIICFIGILMVVFGLGRYEWLKMTHWNAQFSGLLYQFPATVIICMGSSIIGIILAGVGWCIAEESKL